MANKRSDDGAPRGAVMDTSAPNERASEEVTADTVVDLRAPEEWAKALQTPEWEFAGAGAMARWPYDARIARTDFEAAIRRFTSITCG